MGVLGGRLHTEDDQSSRDLPANCVEGVLPSYWLPVRCGVDGRGHQGTRRGTPQGARLRLDLVVGEVFGIAKEIDQGQPSACLQACDRSRDWGQATFASLSADPFNLWSSPTRAATQLLDRNATALENATARCRANAGRSMKPDVAVDRDGSTTRYPYHQHQLAQGDALVHAQGGCIPEHAVAFSIREWPTA